MRLSEQQQPNQAIEILQQLIDRFGDDPAHHEIVARALLYRGVRLAELKRPTEALSDVERAVNLYEELAAADPDAVTEGLDFARQLLADVRRFAAGPGSDPGPAS